MNWNWILPAAVLLVQVSLAYEPNWESLDSRPLPAWYDGAKIGIFMHFGVFSVPSFRDEWFWNWWKTGHSDIVKFMEDNYPPNFTYQDFGSELKMEFFNATQFADLVKASGAKYFVFTTKHHEGFTNFPSPYTFGWNSMDIGPKRDVLGELRDAFKKHDDLHFGIYYSLFEWYNPIYQMDHHNQFKTREYVLNKMLPEMKYLATHYEPEVWWSDGDNGSPEYFGTQEFLAWLFTHGPTNQTVVTNDRWGSGTSKKHGSFFSGPDRFNPGHIQEHKFESCFTMDKWSWGYRRNINIDEVMKVEEIVSTLVEIIAFNGNVLINVGPTKEGTISPIFQERLIQLGQWLKVNGDAIYDTKPFIYQTESFTQGFKVYYTSKSSYVYAIALGWPKANGILTLKDIILNEEKSTIELLGYNAKLLFTQKSDRVEIQFPDMSSFLEQCGIHCLPGYALKISNARPRPNPQIDFILL